MRQNVINKCFFSKSYKSYFLICEKECLLPFNMAHVILEKKYVSSPEKSNILVRTPLLFNGQPLRIYYYKYKQLLPDICGYISLVSHMLYISFAEQQL